ncbi:hypothetical protein MUSASHINO07_14660 [Gemella sp. Musashino-2025]
MNLGKLFGGHFIIFMGGFFGSRGKEIRIYRIKITICIISTGNKVIISI